MDLTVPLHVDAFCFVAGGVVAQCDRRWAVGLARRATWLVCLGGCPYAFDMSGGFVPFRRDVAYVAAQEVPIAPLLDALEFVEDRAHWGYKFRFGLFQVSDSDMRLIAQAMRANLALLHL